MNTAVNGSSCTNWLNPTAEKIVKTSVYSLTFVVSLLGNTFITIVVYRTQALKKPINLFIVNMAISDLLFPIFMFPLNLTQLYAASDSGFVSGPFGHALCKLIVFLPSVSVAVSIQSLVLIAVDRFGAVVFPFRSQLIGSRLCAFFILATWIIAMAFNSPYISSLKLVEYPRGQPRCEFRWEEIFGEPSTFAYYVITWFVTFYFIPTVLLIVLYSVILGALKTQVFPSEQSVSVEEQRARRNKSVLKMSIAILLGFALCWLPWSSIILLFFFVPDSSSHCGLLLYHDIAWFMAQANCAINPVICFLSSERYRQSFKRLLKCFETLQE